MAKAEGRSGGRKGDDAKHARIVALREAGKSIARTAELAECDRSTVKRVWAAHRAAQEPDASPET
ncbi:helix-turn-helix domain-containing protein, partial [Vibrio parahaemolyticus]